MKTTLRAHGPKSEFLPQVTLAVAEKVLRDIARRNGELIRKRRSRILKDNFGPGYAVLDPQTNFFRSRSQSSDGCDLSLDELAEWYRDDEKNTPWQRLVINSILDGKVLDAESE